MGSEVMNILNGESFKENTNTILETHSEETLSKVQLVTYSFSSMSSVCNY